MIRKTSILALLCVVLISALPMSADAATIQYWINYQEYRDEYRVDFTYPTGTATLKLLFTSSSSVEYERTYPISGNLIYLTCNGTYDMEFFDAGNTLIGSFYGIVTTQLINPACNSYTDQTGKRDFNVTYQDNGNGTYNLDWPMVAGANGYKVYYNGSYLGFAYTPGMQIPGNGQVTIQAVNNNDDVLGTTDLFVPTYDHTQIGTPGTGDDGGGSTPGGCDACQRLAEQLACPEWDAYMGEWSKMIRDSLPPPPDWNAISQIFATSMINALNNYLGDVPAAPTTGQIAAKLPAQPVIDSSFPEAGNLVPSVSNNFNQPFDFDITTGPQIQIVDESSPFEINDPLQDLDSSGVGVPVLPGDPANHSGGIKYPESIEVETPLPVPKTNPSSGGELPIPGETTPAPNNPVPIPRTDPGDPPTPGIGENEIPIPRRMP